MCRLLSFLPCDDRSSLLNVLDEASKIGKVQKQYCKHDLGSNSEKGWIKHNKLVVQNLENKLIKHHTTLSC
jgi:hypothetical protein